jgi:hypothetical protein
MMYDGRSEDEMSVCSAIFDSAYFMLTRSIPAVFVSGPLVGLRRAVRQYRQD